MSTTMSNTATCAFSVQSICTALLRVDLSASLIFDMVCYWCTFVALACSHFKMQGDVELQRDAVVLLLLALCAAFPARLRVQERHSDCLRPMLLPLLVVG